MMVTRMVLVPGGGAAAGVAGGDDAGDDDAVHDILLKGRNDPRNGLCH